MQWFCNRELKFNRKKELKAWSIFFETDENVKYKQKGNCDLWFMLKKIQILRTTDKDSITWPYNCSRILTPQVDGYHRSEPVKPNIKSKNIMNIREKNKNFPNKSNLDSKLKSLPNDKTHHQCKPSMQMSIRIQSESTFVNK